MKWKCVRRYSGTQGNIRWLLDLVLVPSVVGREDEELDQSKQEGGM